MKSLVQARIPLAWLLLAAIACGAVVITWKVAVLDAPPAGSAYIIEHAPGPAPSTITPFGAAPAGAPAGGAAGTGDQGGAISSLLPSTPPASANRPSVLQQDGTSATPATTVTQISVYISGAVARPGVYELPEGSRVNNAVEAAGGASADADLEQINLAQKLADGDHITVYRKGEVAPTPTDSTSGLSAGSGKSKPAALTTPPAQRTGTGPPPAAIGTAKPTPAVKINLNSASAADLEQLPGIGPALAQRIIADRQQNGPFASVDDLSRISGIKSAIIARLRDYVTVGP